MGQNAAIARAVILAYLSNGMRPDGLYDIYEINHGNKEVLLGHVMALKGIFEKAIKEIEDDKRTC